MSPRSVPSCWWQSWELWLSSFVVSENWRRLLDFAGEGLRGRWVTQPRPWILGRTVQERASPELYLAQVCLWPSKLSLLL